MQKRLTPTLALIIAGGLAAGVALARPATPATSATTPLTTEAPSGGFLGSGETPRRGFLGNESAPAGAAAAGAPQIEIVDFGFGGSVTVVPGQRVVVSNRDGSAHTVTAESGAFDTGSIAGEGTTTFTAPSTPGNYSFFCSIHPSMQGELIVQG